MGCKNAPVVKQALSPTPLTAAQKEAAEALKTQGFHDICICHVII
jgi:hypothetical protein